MPKKIFSLSNSPYFDDYDQDKDFSRILFRPSYPVQARELTQIQSIIQNQITRLGDSLYRDGAQISRGTINLETEAIRLYFTGSGNVTFPSSGALSTATLSQISAFEGMIISNEDGTVKARVIKQPTSVNKDLQTGNVFIKYLTANTFSSTGGYVYAFTSDNPDLPNSIYNTFSLTSVCSLATIAEGSYYVKGIFAHVAEQVIVLDYNSTTPSCQIGLQAAETLITQDDDASLYDNARGTTNEGSPGAHRLKISLSLISKSLTEAADSSFYRQKTVVDGVIVDQRSQSEQLAGIIVDTMARRTFDESGHYALKPFTHVMMSGDSDIYVKVKIGPSKAYVKGYEVTKLTSTDLTLDNGLETKETKQFQIPFVGTTYVEVNAPAGTAVFDIGDDVIFSNGTYNIGRAKIFAIDGDAGATIKLYLMDVVVYTHLQLSNTTTWDIEGYPLKNGKITFNVTKDISATAPANTLIVTNKSGDLSSSLSVTSMLTGQTATVVDLDAYGISDITQIKDVAATNTYTVVANSWKNSNSELVQTIPNTLKTISLASFDALTKTATATSASSFSDIFKTTTYWEQTADTQITKTLKFAYMVIKKDNDSLRTTSYGWSSTDREITLKYPDIHEVYGVFSLDSDTALSKGAFPRVGFVGSNVNSLISNNGQGKLLIGKTSGSVAIVALMPGSSSLPQVDLPGTVPATTHGEYHGTGTQYLTEVVFITGTKFEVGEELTVRDVLNQDTVTTSTVISFTDSAGKDVTGAFDIDDGQRGEFYDVGRLVRKSDVQSLNNHIVVFFSYFEAGATGQYFGVNSYDGISFKRDVRYFGKVRENRPLQKETGRNLRNSIDIRPRVSVSTDTTLCPLLPANRTITPGYNIIPSTTFEMTFTEYLGRIDMITLDKEGSFSVVKGVSDLNPKKPEEIEDRMTISFIPISPYCRYSETEITPEVKDNRRYTMRDIGQLEARIFNVEQSIALNRLEIQALQDDIEGRTRSGFTTDDFSFTSDTFNSSADRSDVDFNSSIDIINRWLIPSQTAGTPIPMLSPTTSNINTTFFENYALNSFKEVEMISQMKATGSYKINPFAVWTFDGEIKLTPNEDHWHIRKDDYFTSLYGELKPFVGSASDFQKFSQIQTSSPGGASTSLFEWIGAETVERTQSGSIVTDVTKQAQRVTTTTTFDTPRASGQATETYTGTVVLDDPKKYQMRSITVSFAAKGLRPATAHTGYFGNTKVTAVTSDLNGDVSGSFTIPALTFPVGSETFKLVDTESNGGYSQASSVFRSIGYQDSFSIVQNTVMSTTDVATVNNVEKSRVSWRDPIAQLFMLPVDPVTKETLNSTVIVTSVDIWFSFVDTRTSMNYVEVEIREAVNGYPGGPDKIIGYSGRVDVYATNQVTAPTSSNGKNIKFREPVILEGGKEYALVIKSPSDLMAVFVAEMGAKLVDGSGIHSSQPQVGGYSGSFFVSQNSSTWTAEQNLDLTFRINRARFDTSLTGTLTFNNNTSANLFSGDIGAYNRGLALETFEKSYYVKVYHPNHGLHAGQYTKLTGLGTTKQNGLNLSALDGAQLTVELPTLNSYVVNAKSYFDSEYATASGRLVVPTFEAFGKQNVIFDSVATNFMTRKFGSDKISLSLTTRQTVSQNIDSDGDDLIKSSIASFTSVTNTIEPNTYFEFEDPMIVRGDVNGGTNDLSYSLAFKSGTNSTSPIIKLGNNVNPVVFRNIIGKCLTDNDVLALTRTGIVTLGDTNENLEFISRVQGIQSETEHSAYVTKQIDLEEGFPADGFTIFFTADMEPTSAIDIAYKIRPIGSTTPFEELDWVDFPTNQFINEFNYGPFSSKFDPKSYSARAATPHEFSSFKIRLRLRTQNEAQIPRIKDLRIIADV